MLLLSKRWLRVRILLILFFFKINVHIIYIALYSVRNKVKDWSLFSRQVTLTNKSPLASLTILRYKKSRPGRAGPQGSSFESEQWTTHYCIYNTKREDQVVKKEGQAMPPRRTNAPRPAPPPPPPPVEEQEQPDDPRRSPPPDEEEHFIQPNGIPISDHKKF